MWGLVGTVLNLIGRFLPFLVAYKKGKEKKELESLRKEVKDVADAKKIESDTANMSRDDLIKWLSDNK